MRQTYIVAVSISEVLRVRTTKYVSAALYYVSAALTYIVTISVYGDRT